MPSQMRGVRLDSQKLISQWGTMAHAYNPSYSGGRDQEDHVSKPAWANSSWHSILEKSITRKGLVEWLKVKALSSSPSTAHTQKKELKWHRVHMARIKLPIYWKGSNPYDLMTPKISFQRSYQIQYLLINTHFTREKEVPTVGVMWHGVHESRQRSQHGGSDQELSKWTFTQSKAVREHDQRRLHQLLSAIWHKQILCTKLYAKQQAFGNMAEPRQGCREKEQSHPPKK
jgi:hypothetical protein